MSSFDAVLSSWPAEPWLAASLLVIAAIYFRGWRVLRQRNSARWNGWRLAAFCGSVATIYLALASPIETFAPFLLRVHMLQHLLLTMAAPPLVWLAAPMLPLLRGLPMEVRRYWIVPLFGWRPLRSFFATLTHPIAALILFTATTWLWHLPVLYQLALENNGWHVVQHLCFIAAGLVFWYPVVRPFPARPAWPTWLLVPYLLLADVQNTIFSALLTFSSDVWYPHYAAMPRLGGDSAIDDQAAAGVLMWVPGSVAFLLPLAWIGLRLMWPTAVAGFGSQESGVKNAGMSHPGRPRNPSPAQLSIGKSAFDLLRLSTLGAVLRWRWTRRIVQSLVFLLAIAVIADGLFGPQIAPMNLAGVAPWIHWRGLMIIGLLIAGNVFCYGCPFMLPRTIARKLFSRFGQIEWPHQLRSKWLAIGLVAIFLWAYEAFALWNSPWITAWIAIAYFAGALVIDGVFRDAAFCKYVCPIGQFNFVQSMISPLEVRVRQPAVCTSCRTHECIRGSVQSPGCELQLFQPRKSSNLDCTFCLDCVQACPHENVGVIAIAPMKHLWSNDWSTGIGRIGQRFDYAALALLLVFGAFANAAGMVAPIVAAERQISELVGWSTFWVVTAFFVLALFAMPAVLIGSAAATSHRLGFTSASRPTIFETISRFAWSLVPLGFAMWLAHYCFHFFTSAGAIVPATQRFVADFRLGSLGTPDWICSCCQPPQDWLLRAELIALDVGMLGSLYVAWRLAQRIAGSHGRTFRFALPWAMLILMLFTFGVWIVLQPMEMRGTLPN